MKKSVSKMIHKIKSKDTQYYFTSSHFNVHTRLKALTSNKNLFGKNPSQ